MLFSKKLPIDITLWNRVIRADAESSVTDLNGKTVFKVQQANLTNVLQLRTCLADL